MSTSDFRFFRVPKPSLNSPTNIYFFRRKVTKTTIVCFIQGNKLLLPGHKQREIMGMTCVYPFAHARINDAGHTNRFIQTYVNTPN